MDIKSRLEKFKSRPFVKDVAILQVGSFFSIGLSFITSVVFARVLGTDWYGIYAIIFAFAGILTMFMDMGAAYATPVLLAESYNKKDKQETKNILTYFIKVTLLVSATIGIIAIIFSAKLADIFYQNFWIGHLARFVIFAIIVQVFFYLLTLTLHAIRKIKYLTIVENINKFLYAAIPITFVLLGKGLFGVVFGHLLTAVIFMFLSIYLYSNLAKKDEVLPSITEIFKNFFQIRLKKYFSFGFLIALNNNFAKIYELLPILFLGIFVAHSEVGFYKIAFSYISLPLLLARPISRLLQVQLPKSKTFGIKSLRNDFKKVTLISTLIAFLAVIPFLLVAPFLVKLFYGVEYIPAINLIYYLAPLAVIMGLGVGVGPIFRTINKVDLVLKINIVSVIIGTPTVFFLTKFYGVYGLIFGIILWRLAMFVVDFIFIKKHLDLLEKSSSVP